MLSQGKYFTIAADWALMLPIVEMAQNPIALDKVVYLLEPSGAVSEWDMEEAIGEIVQRPSYSQLSKVVAVIGDAKLDESDSGRQKRAFAEVLGCMLADAGYRIRTGSSYMSVQCLISVCRWLLWSDGGSMPWSQAVL